MYFVSICGKKRMKSTEIVLRNGGGGKIENNGGVNLRSMKAHM
jgi:hypothetical protein